MYLSGLNELRLHAFEDLHHDPEPGVRRACDAGQIELDRAHREPRENEAVQLPQQRTVVQVEGLRFTRGKPDLPAHGRKTLTGWPALHQRSRQFEQHSRAGRASGDAECSLASGNRNLRVGTTPKLPQYILQLPAQLLTGIEVRQILKGDPQVISRPARLNRHGQIGARGACC
jgi:hypothetical protein